MKRFEIVLLQGAQSDLLSIFSGQGERLYSHVDKTLGILRYFPEAGPIKHGQNLRRLLVTKTTLGIFYTVSGTRVMIGAILDLRQSPNIISKRVREL